MKKKILAIASAALLSNAAFAASDGNLEVGGSASQGNLDIFLTVDTFIQVSGLNDINLGTYAGTAVSDQSDSFCVRTNAAAFGITFDDYANGSATKFELEEDGVGTTTIDYTLSVSTLDESSVASPMGAVPFNTLISGIAETRSLANCDVSGTPVDNVEVSVSVAETGANGLAVANAGSYTGHLGITVSPE